MKKAAKAFIWIGMIFGFYMIYTIVVGVLALKKINRATTKAELQGIGIVTLFFCSFLGGIFMLCIDETDLADSKKREGSEKYGRNSLNTPIVVGYEQIMTETEQRALNGGNTAKATRVMMWMLLAFATVCFFLDIIITSLNINRPACAILALLSGISQMVAIVVPAWLYFANKQWLNKTRATVLAYLLLLQFLVIAMSSCLICYAVFDSGFDLGQRSLIVFTLVLFSLSIILTIVILSINHKIFYKTKRAIIKSRLEIELEKIQNLLDKQVITPDEYRLMREKIIKESL